MMMRCGIDSAFAFHTRAVTLLLSETCLQHTCSYLNHYDDNRYKMIPRMDGATSTSLPLLFFVPSVSVYRPRKLVPCSVMSFQGFARRTALGEEQQSC